MSKIQKPVKYREMSKTANDLAKKFKITKKNKKKKISLCGGTREDKRKA